MDAASKQWEWGHTLALAEEGDILEVEAILYSGLQDHLRDVGVEPGTSVSYLGKDPSGVWLRVQSGEAVRIARNYAWFIVVKPRSNGHSTSD